jgi:xanthine/CO dehydrogenase XdhC/CoxF family maturation factor
VNAGVRRDRFRRRRGRWEPSSVTSGHEPGRLDGRTVICVLTHDPKFDVQLLEVALRLPEVGYVGAMAHAGHMTTVSSGCAGLG